MRAWLEATGQVRFERLLSVFRFRWRSAGAGRRGQETWGQFFFLHFYVHVRNSQSRVQGFALPILALPGPLIPRVVFVSEGWTSASLNLSLLALVLPLSSSLHVSSPREAVTGPMYRYQCAVPDP